MTIVLNDIPTSFVKKIPNLSINSSLSKLMEREREREFREYNFYVKNKYRAECRRTKTRPDEASSPTFAFS